jgi:hypothetical protein
MDKMGRVLERLVHIEDGCWLWPGFCRDGYGVVTRGAKSYAVHRLVWEEIAGPIPAGLVLARTADCPHRHCANPAHHQLIPETEKYVWGRRERIGVVNRSKTHCPRGHAYAGENLFRYGGRRLCRTCQRQRSGENRRAL